MTWDEINAIIQRHGGTVSAPVVVDPIIDNPTDDLAERRLNPKITNPNPTYRYNLKDGKHFTARATASDENGGATAFQIVDPGSAVQPLTPADRLPSPAQDLVKLDARGNVIPPGDTTTPAAKLRDPSTGAVTDLDPKGPAEGTVKEFGNQLLNIKPDGTYTVITSKSSDPAAKQAITTFDGPDGGRYEYDPNQPQGQRMRKLLDAPADKTVPKTEVRNGVTFQWDPAGGVWKEAPGLPSETKPATVYNDPKSPDLVWYDDQGNEVRRQPKVGWQPPPPTQLTPDTVSATIPLLKADGTIQFVPNQNRVPAGQAMQDIAAQLGVAVDGQTLSMADAKDVLTAAANAMNAQTARQQAATAQQGVARAAAGDILSAQSQGATTGAGLLQQRQQTAQNLVKQGLDVATSTGGRYGNYSGGMLNPVPGLGQALTQGAQAYATELGGGQEVYDTAVRMVQAADPRGTNPDRAAAVGVLRQLMERYQQASGQDHPAVAATKAIAASSANGGLVAPATVNPAEVGPAVFQAQFDPRLNPAAPQQPVNTVLPPGVAGTVAPGDPRYLGILPTVTQPRSAAQLGFTAPGMSPTAGLTQALGDPYGVMR